MSSRGTILLAVGMLILGLFIGVMSGGVTGFFIGRDSQRAIVGQNVPMMRQQPFQAFPQPQQPKPQPTPPATPFANPRDNNGFPRLQNVAGGARVEEVEKNGPADKAGLQVADVITAVGGTKLDQTHSLSDLIKTHKPSEKIELAITRGDKTMAITVELGAAPQDSSAAYLGIRYTPLVPGGRFRFPND